MSIDIVLRAAGSGQVCADILAELPEWFGIPESNAGYAHDAETGPAWIALDDDRPLAIMILKLHGDDAAEIHLMGVRPDRHHRGIGRALVERANAFAAGHGARYLTVKTLGPSREYEPYARTRAFYRAMGFAPLEEFDSIWGPENPCLFMVRPVTP